MPADVVFILDEKPHAHFSRDGANLTYTAKVTLRDALLGCTVQVPTISGRTLRIDLTAEVVAPSTVKRVVGEGMPAKAGKGDMLVKFDVAFPARLDADRKRLVGDALAGL